MSKYYSSSIAFGANQTKTEQVVVSPTKIGDVTTDAVSGALTVDEVPTLNSLNPVSSDGVARAVIQAGAELPTRSSEDTGKVLTVANSDGDLEWDEPAEELPDMTGQDGKILGAVDNSGTMTAQWVNPPESYPSVTGNANKVLTVNSGATGVEWAAVPSELPTATSVDNGKVLGVTDTSGNLGWVAQTPAQVNADWNAVSGAAQILNKPTIPSVDQNYNAASTNAQSGVAVAEAIAAIPAPSVDEVPAVTSTDDGKVLTASYSGGQGSYSWQTAQGGGGGGSSYTAGQGIAIDGNNAISVDASASDFSFGHRYDLTGSDNTYRFYIPSGSSAYMHAKNQYYSYMTVASGSVHLVVGANSSNYAVCNTSYEFTNWKLPQSLHIALSTTASDWTFTGNTFTINYYPAYLTVAGTTGSTITPNGETPVAPYVGGSVWFEVVEEPNTLYLKNSIPTVDQSYNASSTHAQSGTAVAQALANAGGINAGGITWTKISGSSITTTSSTLTANLSYSIPSGKTAVQVTIMLRLSNISGSWSTVPKQLSVKLKLGDDYGSSYYYVGSIMSADAWSGGSAPGVWMVSGTVVVPRDWFISIDGIELELPMSTSSLPANYDKDLFVGIA